MYAEYMQLKTDKKLACLTTIYIFSLSFPLSLGQLLGNPFAGGRGRSFFVLSGCGDAAANCAAFSG